jgi:hypothetical protein
MRDAKCWHDIEKAAEESIPPTPPRPDSDNVQIVNECMKAGWEFLHMMGNMHPLSAVILGVARIDVELESLLRKLIDGEDKVKDEKLFSHDRPLGTYSSRYEMCYRLRLIDEPLYRILKIYGKIRNHIAHSHDFSSMASSPIKDWLDAIEEVVSVNDFGHVNEEELKQKREHPFFRFAIPLSMVFQMLMRLRLELKRFEPPYTATVIFSGDGEPISDMTSSRATG